MLREQNAKPIFLICGAFICSIFLNCSKIESSKANYASPHLLQKLKQAQTNKEYNKALSIIANEEKNNPKIAAEIYFIKGNIYASLNSFDDASVAYSQALRIDSSHSHSRNNLSLLLADKGRIQDAINLLSKHTDDPVALLNIALFKIKLGRYLDAEKMLNNAIRLQPENPKTYQLIGSLLLKQGRQNEAERAIVKSWNLDSTQVESARLMGLLYLNKDDSNRAIFFFKRAVSIDPNHLDSIYNLSMALAKAGLIAESEGFMSKFETLSVRITRIAQIRRLLDEQPMSTALRLELATHYLYLNRIDEAESQYHTVLATDSLNNESLINLTKMSIQKNELVSARKFSERGILNSSNKRETAPLYASLGYLNLINGDYTVAEDFIVKSLSFDSTSSEAWNNLGNIYQARKRIATAKKYFDKALSVDSTNSLAAHNLGVIYYQSNSMEFAKSYFYKALRADSTYWQAELALGKTYEEMDSTGAAIRFYKAVHKNANVTAAMKKYAIERIDDIQSNILR
tara:strand:+ start:324 stop:1868 length:1545 start_codon:yes stop_codon:yes gene_type:complete